ncbi:uncharacterized protein LOC6572253 [Drosophila mojavensis]|uniref:Uncharacterized protein n=1 Tax=Drosophila mojavensis TaxID=7230 RepID=B4KDM2_DROMO|nr:uncharacterized protein LOC6572253 [Drosophila mojavensis]EDW13856.1 uncharacterized protein Dmoj_GI23941 [Drosophila mojavensis]
MTYSHNSVRNNIKMTTASATKSIRLKKGATTPSPPPTSTTTIDTATPTVNAHSNSIASSTNFSNQHFQQQQVLSTSPTHCAPITPNNRMQQQQQRLQSQSAGANQRSRQQRQSPQQMGGGGFFFANNNRRNGGGPRSPQSAAGAAGAGATGSNNGYVRQSPATILGGGFSPAAFGSARKQRRSPTTTPTSSFGVGGKISPQHQLIPNALTHFAGSKCFDAPAPTALPKPPQHWTSLSKSEEKLVASSAGTALQSLLRGGDRCSASKLQPGHGGVGGYVVKSSKRNLLDDFDTHNLKLLLNMQS